MNLYSILIQILFLLSTASALATVKLPCEANLAPVVGTPASQVRYGAPIADDLHAVFEKDGYEIVRPTPRISVSEQREIFHALKNAYGERSFILRKLGAEWVLDLDETRYQILPDNISVRLIRKIIRRPDIPHKFIDILESRKRYLDIRFAGYKGLMEINAFEIRVGQWQPSDKTTINSFHVDGYADILAGPSYAEALHRGPNSGGTLVVGKGGNVFEVPEGAALIFTSQRNVFDVRAPLHSAPSQNGDRVFIRATNDLPNTEYQRQFVESFDNM